MDKIEKIRQEIESLYDGEAPKHDQQCDFGDGYFTGLSVISNFLDTLSKEPDKSLEEEIATWIPAHISIGTDETLSANPTELADVCREWGKCVARHFAQWGAEHFRDSTMMIDKSLEEAADIIGKAISYFGAESLLDNANGLTDFEKFTAWLYCEFLRGLPKKLNQDYIKEQSKVILGAIKKELGKMPDSTELIAQWDAEREMLEQKDFRGDEWRLAQNAYFDGFGSGYLVQEQQMLKDAFIDNDVIHDGRIELEGDPLPSLDPILILPYPQFEPGDKVRILVLKAEEE